MQNQQYIKPDLLSVIEKFTNSHVSYGKAICCPFHHEKDPSLHIYEDQHWYCFGCNRSGDAYDFYGYLRYGDAWDSKNPEMFREAAKMIRSSSCKSYVYTDEPKPQEKDVPPESYSVLKWVTNVYHRALLRADDPAAAGARKYLFERGYNDDVIRRLKIGYAGHNVLYKKGLQLDAEKRIVYVEELKKLKLLNENGREYYYNRIIFPNVTKEGEVTNLTGRALSKKAGKRYLNIPEFKKQLYLIGLSNPELPLYLMESVTDTVSMRQLGYQSVAVNGTALSKKMAASLDPFKKIIIVPQNDLASQNAASTWCDMVPRCKVLLLDYVQGKQKDMNDILRQEGDVRAKAKIERASEHLLEKDEYMHVVLDLFSRKEN
ncbi:MAG: toprim domain-containing protein [Anaerolineaceae bacterium]|nr:toprim domain-containing protein [Anaerolineaceae bacterium]